MADFCKQVVFSSKISYYSHIKKTAISNCHWPRIRFSHSYGKKFSSVETPHALTKYQQSRTSGRSARESYQTMFPEVSARWSLLWAKLQIPVFRQWGREKSSPGLYTWHIPFIHSALSSVHKYYQFLYICYNILVVSSLWYVQVCLGAVSIWQLRVCSCRSTFRGSELKSCWVPYERYVLVHTGTK